MYIYYMYLHIFCFYYIISGDDIVKKICCFTGHRKIHNPHEIYNKLLNTIEKIIINDNVKDFQMGNYGAFDRLVIRALNELKLKYDIKTELIIPYLTKEINQNREEYYKNYNSITVADIPLSTPHKLRIIKCNEYMIKNCDYLICHIQHSWGGAYKTVSFAKKQKNISIIKV